MAATSDSGRHYHKECTGLALETVKAHQTPEDITLFGSCFCPFVQRVWVAFEVLGIPYKVTIASYSHQSALFIIHLSTVRLIDASWTLSVISSPDEVDPYKKPKDLLEVSPKGLVPGLKLHKYNPPRALNESTVILEYLEDLAAASTKRSLLPSPSDPCMLVGVLTDARALVRLAADHINRHLVPAFYRFLQAQSSDAQITHAKELHDSIQSLFELFDRAEKDVLGGGGFLGDGELKATKSGLGLWFEGGEIGLADVMAGPCEPKCKVLLIATKTSPAGLFRASNVLKHYRGFVLSSGPKTKAYLERLFGHPAFKATCMPSIGRTQVKWRMLSMKVVDCPEDLGPYQIPDDEPKGTTKVICFKRLLIGRLPLFPPHIFSAGQKRQRPMNLELLSRLTACALFISAVVVASPVPTALLNPNVRNPSDALLALDTTPQRTGMSAVERRNGQDESPGTSPIKTVPVGEAGVGRAAMILHPSANNLPRITALDVPLKDLPLDPDAVHFAHTANALSTSRAATRKRRDRDSSEEGSNQGGLSKKPRLVHPVQHRGPVPASPPVTDSSPLHQQDSPVQLPPQGMQRSSPFGAHSQTRSQLSTEQKKPPRPTDGFSWKDEVERLQKLYDDHGDSPPSSSSSW
ncbi:hypothetical protein H0H93_012172 [Arthromyces matolae]|nr:hypothetical protein H0H93_012172 [Arthromyces matolae]